MTIHTVPWYASSLINVIGVKLLIKVCIFTQKIRNIENLYLKLFCMINATNWTQLILHCVLSFVFWCILHRWKKINIAGRNTLITQFAADRSCLVLWTWKCTNICSLTELIYFLIDNIYVVFFKSSFPTICWHFHG